ncbi:hypothetical protein MPL3365_200127 [Mesorhizobium plurifarium]|uniref:Uncharacterized protein n=1 Tax=Mesorhizobium plurifarium TaxID=69974 RepID=A0A090GU75_MESPL|nr:hypothetical protein MPL3365_200127 [Mesorhizobium plurifarium]
MSRSGTVLVEATSVQRLCDHDIAGRDCERRRDRAEDVVPGGVDELVRCHELEVAKALPRGKWADWLFVTNELCATSSYKPRAAGVPRRRRRRQVVRHRFLVPTFPGSTPGAQPTSKRKPTLDR